MSNGNVIDERLARHERHGLVHGPGRRVPTRCARIRFPTALQLTTLPNERTFTIISGEELVYEDGAAMLPAGDQRFETNLGDELRWGNTELAMLGDFVWEDLNANGIQDPNELDDGINGVEVKLLADVDGDGEVDDVVATTVTTNNPDTGLPGWYKFNGLMPGVEYAVMFNNPDPDGPDAYMFSPRQVDGDPASGVNSDGPMSDVVVLTSGEFNDTLDAGLFRKGSIHVFGFLDVDGDGNPGRQRRRLPGRSGQDVRAAGRQRQRDHDRLAPWTAWSGSPGWYPGPTRCARIRFPTATRLTTLPNERTFTIISGQELVYEDGAAMLPDGDQRFETNLGDDLRWGNTLVREPEINLEKFTRIDVNPIDIEKLVRVQSPAIEGDVCEVLGKPVSLTFQYIPSLEFNPLQPSGKADVIANNGLDDDDTAYVVVAKNNDPSNFGEIFFQGDVSFNETFTPAGSFGSNTYFFFFDEQGGPLLQAFSYHTSCSAPIILGAQPLSATLVGYNDGTPGGNVEAPDFGPGINDADADTPTGPEAMPGDTVVFTYVVSNPIPFTQLSNIQVTDVVLAPVPETEFAPDPVLDGEFNIGDTDKDNRLDAGEVWLYVSTQPITSTTAAGQYVDKATVIGTNSGGGEVMDMDPAHFIVQAGTTEGDQCDINGDIVALTFQYNVSEIVDTNQVRIRLASSSRRRR